MTELIIRLKGEIQDSNFDDWKRDLVARLRGVNTELVRDEDFARASEQVKAFKNAELALKTAKQSAIDQAAEIQRLFGAIDGVAEETRQVRLMLERQIKARKQEIKAQMIEGAINAVHAAIARQSPLFQTLDHGPFLDRARFEAAAKGKSTSATLSRALERLVREIEQEIDQETLRVADNLALVNAIAEEHRMLFQDRENLLRLSAHELRLTIDTRIARYNENQATRRAAKAVDELKRIEEQELNPVSSEARPTEEAAKERFRITLELLASREQAIDLARVIREKHGDDEAVESVRLSRAHE